MFNCIIYGGTGAIGREFIDLIKNSEKWNNIYIITRRMIERFDNVKNDKRFHFFKQADIDDKTELLKEIKEKKVEIDCVFNFLGSRVGKGKEQFIKVDKTYVINSARLAENLKCRLFLHVTAKASSSNSMFLYMKTKGQVEDELKNIKLPNISILKPGLLLGRDNDARIGEKIFSYVPFISKINVKQVADYALQQSELTLDKKLEKGYQLVSHDKMIKKKYLF